MPSQFLHLSTYGRQARKGATPTATIAGILMEASRQQGAVAHIATPRPPVLLHGVLPAALIPEAVAVSEIGRDMSGRHIRCDGGILVAGVISYPKKRTVATSSEVEGQRCDAWFKATREWLRKHFGDHLRSVVAHLDEEYPHVHFFMIARLRSDDLLDWAGIHPGVEAKRMSSLHGETTRTQDARYRGAMRELQDAFHKGVSSFFEHDRFGPKRKRVSRLEAVSRKAVEKEREAHLEEIAQQKTELRQKIEAYEKWLDNAKHQFGKLLTNSMIRLKPVERDLVLAQYRHALSESSDSLSVPSQLQDIRYGTPKL